MTTSTTPAETRIAPAAAAARPGPLVGLAEPHVDARGAIQSLLEQECQSAMLITSRRGAVRANHYHRSDWHHLFVLVGSMDYYHRPVGSTDPPDRVRVRAGDMVFTPPLVEHAVVFLDETVMLGLAKNGRSHEDYESDVVRVPLVDVARAASDPESAVPDAVDRTAEARAQRERADVGTASGGDEASPPLAVAPTESAPEK